MMSLPITLFLPVQIMEIKTVSTGSSWKNHLHRLAFHLHGHRHGHLHQVPLKPHCNLHQNNMFLLGFILGGMFLKWVKSPLLEKPNPIPSSFVCLDSEPHTTKLWRDVWQAMFSYWIAKLSHLLWTCVSQTFPQTFFFIFISFSFFLNRNEGGVQCS